MASAIAGPLLFFTGFVLFAAGRGTWAILPVLVAIALGLCFPVLEIGSPDRPEPVRGPLVLLRMAAAALMTFWAIHLPELGALLDRLLGGALWDWKPVTAAGLWTFLLIQANLRMLSLMSDEMIFRYYDKSRAETGQA